MVCQPTRVLNRISDRPDDMGSLVSANPVNPSGTRTCYQPSRHPLGAGVREASLMRSYELGVVDVGDRGSSRVRHIGKRFQAHESSEGAMRLSANCFPQDCKILHPHDLALLQR